jgi:hypothetical protein
MVNDGALVFAPDRLVLAFDDERLVADAANGHKPNPGRWDAML